MNISKSAHRQIQLFQRNISQVKVNKKTVKSHTNNKRSNFFYLNQITIERVEQRLVHVHHVGGGDRPRPSGNTATITTTIGTSEDPTPDPDKDPVPDMDMGPNSDPDLAL
jgi:hypothetical protein